MPFPNEHACRVADPGLFQKDSFRRIKKGDLVLIIAKKKGATTTSTQAFRYPKGDWTAARAKAHCKKEKGDFEVASAKENNMVDNFVLLNKLKKLKRLMDEEFKALGELLRNTVAAKYPGYWMREYSTTEIILRKEGPEPEVKDGDEIFYRLTYQIVNGEVLLGDSLQKVRAVLSYVPVE